MFALDPTAAGRDLAKIEVDITPPQCEQLRPPRSSGPGQDQQNMERRVAGPDVLEQRAELLDGRWFGLAGDGGDAMGAVGGVIPDPSPSHGLGQRRVQDDVDAFGRPRRPRLAALTAPGACSA